MYGQFQAAAPRRVLQIPSAVLHRPTALCALVPVYYSLSKHFSYYPVVNTLTFLPHFVNEKFKRPVVSQGDSFFPDAGVGSFHDKQLDDAGRVHAGVVDGE